MKTKILALILCFAMCLSSIALLSSCVKEKDNGGTNANKPDRLVIMTEELDGLFNPFFSTTAADGTIVGMTQLGMISYDYKDGEVVEAFGDGIASVAKDYTSKYNVENNTTTYSFVIKNGIKFSDGMPLTMNDVLFNMYVYLDPVYTGSSTMYSIDIVGLQEYRNQQETSDSTGSDSIISQTASNRANNRVLELVNLFKQAGKTGTQGSYYIKIADMKNFLADTTPSYGYKEAVAVSSKHDTITGANLVADYEKVLEYFEKELTSDYEGAKENFVEEPYKSLDFEFTDIRAFMALEGYITFEYETKADGKPDYNKIKKVNVNYGEDVITSKEAAIKFVKEDKIQSAFDQVITMWATANEIFNDFKADAMSVLLEENRADDGSLKIPNISGIVSLGHTSDVQEIKIGETTYKVAHEHNADGTVKNEGEYDVLQITINGVDPRAIWSFAFSVAPHHYYAPNQTVDIANNKFGVEYASSAFMFNTLKRSEINSLPMGAGPYKASNYENGDNPKSNEFHSNNSVYFKANTNFLLGTPKTEKVCYQVVSSSNALDALAAGTVHFVSPQLTDSNNARLEELKSSGIESIYTNQLGYGYIGINAGRIPDMNIRKAIMTAMDTSRAIAYYRSGTASTIFWPMSTVSWAYPTNPDGTLKTDNQHSYPAKRFSDEQAKADIKALMDAAGVKAGDSKLSMKFTIAGSNLIEHPAYTVFLHAAEILNDLGWNVEVVSDIQALTKLSTGSLSVWAAAWGSSIDPDLYQVYHKDSTATSTLAWGYKQILENPSQYEEENRIINELSVLIDEARETNIKDTRKEKYEEAMKKILDLAVELPLYQRSVLYAYNSNVINESTLPETINPFTSPLDKIWEIELVG